MIITHKAKSIQSKLHWRSTSCSSHGSGLLI